MKKFLFLLWAMALPVAASPQTSDADLKAQQAPAVTPPNGYVTPGIDYGDARVKFGTVIANQLPGDFTNVGAFDLSSVTSLSPASALYEATGSGSGQSGLTLDGDANLAALKLVPGNITSLQAGAALNPDGDFDSDYTGCGVYITATNLSADPGFGVTIIQGGAGLDNEGFNPALGGAALLSLNSCTFTSAVSRVAQIISGTAGGFPQRETGGAANLSYANNAGLTSLDLSALINVTIDNSYLATGFDCSACPALSSVAMAPWCHVSFPDYPVGYGPGGGAISFNGAALNAAALNVILSSLSNAGAAADSTNGFPLTLDISGGTNASPDTTGVGYIAVLTALGWTVSTN